MTETKLALSKLSIDRLPRVQKEVYLQLKKHAPTTAQFLAVEMKKSLRQVQAILRLLRKKNLVNLEGLMYSMTTQTYFLGTYKNKAEEFVMKNENIQDQIEWNKKILQQKAQRELRMSINI